MSSRQSQLVRGPSASVALPADLSSDLYDNADGAAFTSFTVWPANQSTMYDNADGVSGSCEQAHLPSSTPAPVFNLIRKRRQLVDARVLLRG